MDAIYTEGDTVLLHTDLYPAFVQPLPAGVPGHGVRKRVVVTEKALTIGWAVSGRVQRIDIPMTVEQTAMATLRGGKVGSYDVGIDRACAGCGSGAIKNWKPWPGIILKQEPRTDLAAAALRKDKNYATPPARYSRSRP